MAGGSVLPERWTGVWMYDGFVRIFITFAGLLDIWRSGTFDFVRYVFAE